MLGTKPVVLFVFKRLDTVKMIVDVVKQYQPVCIYVFADGARKDVEGEIDAVNGVRDYITEAFDWECDKRFFFAENNKGCDKNIRDGLDKVFSEQDSAIILEDDAIPTLQYFTFCDFLLNKYRDTRSIQFIAGFNSIGDLDLIKNSYSFGKTVPLNGAYATWADRWNECDFDMKNWPLEKKNRMLDEIFFFKELRKQYYRIYDAAYSKELTAWDYLFEHDMLSRDGLAVVPRINLVTSYGFVEGAYHPQRSSETKRFKKIMTAPKTDEQLLLDDNYEVVRNYIYDKTRQKLIMELKGNYLERRMMGVYLTIKEFAYDHLSENTWNFFKKIVTPVKKR
ncbi:hypothetical protein [Butyrivibrio proteoclasticus]|uniref:hypothetical protein n=1 Tax=Butyrivibrio proteoclasticus TaxID=43305 RepID=UPI000479C204|nr:hypothetical protein [Butyrivibrio proteoclasticus]